MFTVLIAEDSVILADTLEDFLISQGYSVCGIARSVDEAVELADKHNPDLAVLDFRLAGGQYSSQIRTRIKNKSTMGILYVSGDPLNTKLTIADGNAYIQKPYGMYDLILALQIVQEIKTNKNFSPLTFPKGFHLLGNTVSGEREAA